MDWIKECELIEKQLSSEDFYSSELGETLRNKLRRLYLVNYIPLNENSFYLDFINKNSHCFSMNRNGSQSSNHPKVFSMFTIESQHIQGNSLEHCIDKYFKD